jgi:murein DD-endopeptidase MepM/ murein hydrolase activator NlpD
MSLLCRTVVLVAFATGCIVGDDPSAGDSASRSRAKSLLPWTAFQEFTVSQGHNTGSHIGSGSWAWDFAMPVGTPVLAAHDGTVRAVKGSSTVGGCAESFAEQANYVVIDQGNGYESLYLHLRGATVAAGRKVKRGEVVGYSGETGWACGPHLHFQIQRSPTAGGTTGWYNESIHDFFWDRGDAWDPAAGEKASSRNGAGGAARTTEEPDGPADHDHAGHAHADLDHGEVFDFHGGAGEAWDLAMQAASGD